jgi:hypothetical protein
MFKKIDIHFTEPVCSCEKEELEWNIVFNNLKTDFALEMTCKKCNTKLIIPRQNLFADYVFDKPYPIPSPNTNEMFSLLERLDKDKEKDKEKK